LRRQRIGLFGLLGTGNLGNDGSLATVLRHVRAAHPDAELHAFCSGPQEIVGRFAIPATRLSWYRDEYETAANLRSIIVKGFGKLVDAFRTAAWVRRQDVVIVPGMGVLESALPIRPWGFPYSLALACLSGKLFGTPVLMLSVGATVIENRLTRSVVVQAARAAGYRSFRDEPSRDAMRAMGVDTSHDEVYPDLVFGAPGPPARTGTGIVGIGVMAYSGGDRDRGSADEIRTAYVARVTAFVRHLAAQGRRIRLFTGDRSDEAVAAAIAAELASPLVEIAEVTDLDELMRAMADVDSVVATRYHNVVCALKLAKPTVSIGYATKNDVLMASMGLGEFCQSAKAVDLGRLIEQFTELERRHDELSAILVSRNQRAAERVRHQLDELSVIVGQTAPRETRVPQEV
jgi:polysaccharide pyruvyl transferase WcaK-like protein